MKSIQPKTTHEQALHTSGERKINMIWEVTQAGIAIAVVVATIAAVFIADVTDDKVKNLVNAFFLIVGFYFGRTNHARIGIGEGRKK